METAVDFDTLQVGYDIPARPGMSVQEVQTPCLVIDLDAFERNLTRLSAECQALGVRLRPHAKMHKSVDVARHQLALPATGGICCQKTSEAEVFARAGIGDILVSNQVRDPAKINRLAQLPATGARIAVCIDDLAAIADLSVALQRHGTTLDILIELDVGAGRCGLSPDADLTPLLRAIDTAPGLQFRGIQAYQGNLQHIVDHQQRSRAAQEAIERTRAAVSRVQQAGWACPVVTGGGTGSYRLEAESGVYTELQCGSYAFMDADYQTVRAADGAQALEFENALFLLTSILSTPVSGRAVCDAGLKAVAVDSGLPVVFDPAGVDYLACSDEHGTLADPACRLAVNDRIRLVPGHCDPTCNLHDWYVVVRDGVVAQLWPVSARGKMF